MMGLLVRREVIPNLEAHRPVQYGSLLPEKEDSRTDRMGIFIGKERIGQTVTSVRRDRNGIIHITNRTDLDLTRVKALGRSNVPSMSARLTAVAHPLSGLKSFRLDVDWDVMPVHVRGVVQNRTLRMSKKIGDAPAQRMEVPIDPKALISSGFSPILGASELAKGKRWDVAVFNPLTLRMEKASAEVKRKETIEVNGEPVETYVVSVRYGPVEVRSWVASDGCVVRQEAPFGILLKREPTEAPRD